MAVQYLELADFLLIAEAVTGTPAEALASSDRTVHLAESALAAPAAAYGGSLAADETSEGDFAILIKTRLP